MDLSTALSRLEAAGKAQYRKIFARHGAKEPMFGVSYGDLGKLKKQIGTDTALARKLWDSGNYDARILATMVADPAEVDTGLIARWAQSIDSDPLAGAVAKLVAGTTKAADWMRQWVKSRDELLSTTGWTLLGILAEGDQLTERELLDALQTIASRIHSSPNRTRLAMNQALISIGAYRAPLRGRALEVAKQIGKVEVDHGETGCKTPDATEYIHKVVQHQQRRAAGKVVQRARPAKKKPAKARK